MTLGRRLLFSSFGGAYTRLSAKMLAAGAGGWPGMPQAFYYGGVSYFGTIRGDTGEAQIGQYVHATGTVTLTTVHTFSPDQHSAPAIMRRPSDGRLITVYCDHAGPDLYCRISTNPDDATSWGAETNIDSQVQGTLYTYPWLLDLQDEGLISLFYRNTVGSSYNWCMSSSSDGGTTWTNGNNSTIVSGTRYYGRSFLSADGRVDFIFTDGSYAEDYASAYHMYRTPGHYYKSDGTEITGEPFAPSELTKIYDGSTAGVRYPASLARDPSGSIVACLPVQTGTPSGHIGEDEDYIYARWNGSSWSTHTIATDVGATSFEFTEGSLAVDPSDLDRVLLSKRVAGSWRMHLYTTTDAGSSWSSTALTDSGGDDIYPGFVEGHVSALQGLWLKGTFTTEDDWAAAIQALGV
jgi:hypothetical protein